MKNSRSFVSFIFCTLWLIILSPVLKSQNFCNSTTGPNSIGAISIPNGNFGGNAGPYFFRIYIHVIRKSDGTGGLSMSKVEEAISYLDKDFEEHQIFFVRDCEIDYIDSDAHYNADVCQYIFGYTPIYSENPHSDGIDVYLFDDNIPGTQQSGCGVTQSVSPGKAFYIKGNYPNSSPFLSLPRSHVISHEMAHCLGLYHTFNFQLDAQGMLACYSYVNNSNCFTCGDFVCDTPVDPNNLSSNITYPACQWIATGSGVDRNGDPFDPDERNIMAYTHPACMEYFTPGQGDRMRRIISISPILQACLVNYSFIAPTITTNTTWTTANTPNNGNFNITGDLTIESGATLNIGKGVTVHFGVNSRLIVKSRARLNLSGTLTGLGCDGLTWKGMEIWGVSKGSTTRPGIFTSTDGALIERAETVAKCYGPDYSMAGGRIVCGGTTFKNNIRGIDIAPFENKNDIRTFGYVGSFSSCHFLTDKDYPHKTPFEYFVQMNGVRGIRLLGCKMENTQPVKTENIADLGYGIKAFDANFSVEVSGINPVFDGLAYGISAERIATGDPFSVTNATFNNCYTGIRTIGVNNATVLFNTFYMGNLPENVPTEKQYGVSFETDISGFEFQENSFIGETGNVEKTTGSACDNLGRFNNVVRRNYYSTLTYANLANGSNAGTFNNLPRGLTYECNYNSDIQKFDIAAVGSIRSKQGLEVLPSDPSLPASYSAAGNYFSYGDGVDIQSSGPIEYYYNPDNFGEEPLTIQGAVQKRTAPGNDCIPVYQCQVNCSRPAPSAPETMQAKQEYYNHESAYSALLQEPSSESRAIKMAFHQRMMDERAQKVLAVFQWDTLNYQQDSVIHWITKLNTPEADLWKATLLASKGDVGQAQQILTASGIKHQLTLEEKGQFSTYANLLSWLTNHQVWEATELSDGLLSELEEYAKSENRHVRMLSRNILTRHGRHFPPEYVFPSDESQERTHYRLSEANYKAVTVRPNPATESAVFEVYLPKETLEADLHIFDVNGRSVTSFHLSTSASVTWDIRSITSGFYYYRLVSNGHVTASGKIFINH